MNSVTVLSFVQKGIAQANMFAAGTFNMEHATRALAL